MKQNAEKYLFSSSRTRALENKLLGEGRLNRLCDAASVEEFSSLLEENGIRVSTSGMNAALNGILAEAFQTVGEMVPEEDRESFSLFSFPYDCHNAKTALKGALGGKEYVSLLLPFGSVPSEEIGEAIGKGNYSLLPKNMANACEQAAESFAKNRDPQQIDLLLDVACFADMAEKAEKSGDPFFTGFVSRRLDSVNCNIAVRLLRMKSAQITQDYLLEHLMPFGSLGEDFFEKATAEGIDSLAEELKKSGYRAIGEAIEKGASLSEIEKIGESILLAYTEEAAGVLYGPAVPAAYLLRREAEVKNLRIIAMSIGCGLSPDRIRARLRLPERRFFS